MVLALDLKPLLIDVPPEREDMYRQLKELFDEARQFASDPACGEMVRIKAIQTAAYIAQIILGYLGKMGEFDEIRKQVAELRELAQRSRVAR
jgi:hypothetical protein